MTASGAHDPVEQLLAVHGFRGPWTALPSLGLANRVYATADVVLRVATDHPEGFCDARTESVAAPAAHRAGVRTPRLLAFDDSGALIDRPYSVWERVHAETLGLAALSMRQHERVWHDVGRELARLHEQVIACDDPNGYLDSPGLEPDLTPTLTQLATTGHVPTKQLDAIARLLDRLAPHVHGAAAARCFVHNDLHAFNVMCTTDGELRALIDWGDAGWGDPVLDLVAIPPNMLQAVIAGYGPAARTRFGPNPTARIVWANLHEAMEAAIEDTRKAIAVEEVVNLFECGVMGVES